MDQSEEYSAKRGVRKVTTGTIGTSSSQAFTRPHHGTVNLRNVLRSWQIRVVAAAVLWGAVSDGTGVGNGSLMFLNRTLGKMRRTN